MDRWLLPIRTLLVTLAALLAADGHAAPPQSLTSLARQSSFSQDDRTAIADYASHWVGQLQTGNLQMVERARDRLREPVKLSSVQFRLEYTRVLVPQLEQAAKSDKDHVAINAVIVLGELGTDSALSTTAALCHESNEDRWYLRLVAARSCGKLLNAPNISTVRIKNALRDVREAAAVEPKGLVLRRQLEAMLGVRAGNGDVDVIARERLAEALAEVVARLERQPETQQDLIEAINAILPDLRDAFIRYTQPQERPVLGRSLAGSLVRILQLASSQWAAGHDDKRLNDVYQQTTLVSEQILKQIDLSVRATTPPDTNLDEAWQRGDKGTFDADLKRWSDLIRQPSYRPS
jgi:hypothetical protein